MLREHKMFIKHINDHIYCHYRLAYLAASVPRYSEKNSIVCIFLLLWFCPWTLPASMSPACTIVRDQIDKVGE